MVLLVVAALGVLFVFIMRINTKAISGAEAALVYPETPPQILSVTCYTTYGHVAVAEELNGTIYYRVTNLNGTQVADSSLTVNIADYGIINFTADMEDGSYYSLRLFTPDWSVTETCTP